MLLAAFALHTFSQAQDTLLLLPVSAPVIDGHYSPLEWAAADSVQFTAPFSNSIKVKLAQDNVNLYFVFFGRLEQANVLFPEILFDLNHSRSAAWEPDDAWFHVSATDCYHTGAYGVFTDCDTVQADWQGLPNFEQGPPYTDTVEILIPFAKLNLVSGNTDTIGLSVLVTNTASTWRHWPVTANRNSPATWGTIILNPAPLAVAPPAEPSSILAWPNPVEGEWLHLRLPDISESPAEIVLRDAMGREVAAWQPEMTRTEITLRMPLLPAGIYFLTAGEAAPLKLMIKPD